MLQYRILGPLEVSIGDSSVGLAGQRQRALLALLLLNANRVVATDSLIDALWGEQPPRTAATSLQNGVAQLRKLLGAETVETRAPGYVLHAEPEQLDLALFERLLERSRTEVPPTRATTLREALALWRGAPLADLSYELFAQQEIRRLEELRLVALEERLEADLASARHAEVIAELQALVAQNPLRERFTAYLMLALHASGRSGEATLAFQATRRRLRDELGLDPGRELQDLHRRILQGDYSVLPGPAARSTPPDHYVEVVRAVLSSRIVPVLGPGVVSGTPAPAPPSPAAAAAHLARVFDCPSERAGGLTSVSQYVAVTFGVGPLYDELNVLYAGDYAPGPVQRAVAALAPRLREVGLPHQLVVTTGYDRTLERAFEEAGEEVDVVSYLALGRDRGKFLHTRHDGVTRVIDEPNVEVGLTTDERTIVLKIHGGSEETPGGERGSYVVSEDDYIDYLAHSQPAALLPVGLAARLRRSHFLFLGYEPGDWSLRVFWRRLWGEERIGYRSWAVSPQSDSLAADYWRQRGVDPIEAPLDAYVGELARRIDVQLTDEKAV
jgi:DNA-binding SARP family transcriptional activator